MEHAVDPHKHQMRRAIEILVRASAAQEAPEVMYALMMDVYQALLDVGGSGQADSIRRMADTMVPMFGLRERREKAALSWWKRRGYVAPDYPARIALYRGIRTVLERQLGPDPEED